MRIASRIAQAEFKILNQQTLNNGYYLPKKEELRDFLTFVKYFYKIRTGRDYCISQPVGREPHQITFCKQVPRLINHEVNRLMLRVPPRYGKTEFAIELISYCIAYFEGGNYLYISYSSDLAVKQTKTIRSIIDLPQFQEIFKVELDKSSKASDDWMTNTGCRLVGAGSGGSITGNGAGIRFSDKFGGLAVLDDLHKPIEVTHEKSRLEMKEWYSNTFLTRLNNPALTPVLGIGQALHEDDTFENLIKVGTDQAGSNPLDTEKWEVILLEGLDGNGNALAPEMHDAAKHLKMKEQQPYMWWSQYQQSPQPAGGSLFKNEWFKFHDETPEIITTFITADTAETNKNWNDATVFSFWGLYKVKEGNLQTDINALHWLDCWELRVEPKDLQTKFDQFYLNCCRFPIKPAVVGIERKSTGATILSILNNYQGIRVVDTIDFRIDPNLKESLKRAKKVDRFLNCQQYVSNKLISFTFGMKHANMCIDHLSKITANESHAFDDIADTMADAIYMALITNFIPSLKSINHKINPGIDFTQRAIKW
jgi:hypothetical protein